MSAHRSRRIDRLTAEQLLRGEPLQADALSELLSAAAAPAAEGELAGEPAAVAAFRAARPAPVLPARKGSMMVKLAAMTVGAVAVGGVAVAAATGTLPVRSGGNVTVPPTTTLATTAASTVRSERPGVAGVDRDTGSSATPSSSSSLKGLCQAYTARAGADHGKALDTPAFTTLVTTAGGKDRVDSYCTDLLGSGSAKPGATHSPGPPTSPHGKAADAKPSHSGGPAAKHSGH
jgi:hypothetical protein